MESKYQLALCEFFNADIHGKNDSSSLHIESHFIILKVIEINIFYDFYEYNLLQQYVEILRCRYARYITTLNQDHPVIRNYKHVLVKKEYVSFEIIELVELEGGEHVGIYKTFWLRIIQRKWKKYYHRKMQMVRKLLKPRGMVLREIGAL